jgi:hypothetical protein
VLVIAIVSMTSQMTLREVGVRIGERLVDIGILCILLHTFDAWGRITDDTRIMFYDERVEIILITWR